MLMSLSLETSLESLVLMQERSLCMVEQQIERRAKRLTNALESFYQEQKSKQGTISSYVL